MRNSEWTWLTRGRRLPTRRPKQRPGSPGAFCLLTLMQIQPSGPLQPSGRGRCRCLRTGSFANPSRSPTCPPSLACTSCRCERRSPLRPQPLLLHPLRRHQAVAAALARAAHQVLAQGRRFFRPPRSRSLSLWFGRRCFKTSTTTSAWSATCTTRHLRRARATLGSVIAKLRLLDGLILRLRSLSLPRFFSFLQFALLRRTTLGRLTSPIREPSVLG